MLYMPATGSAGCRPCAIFLLVAASLVMAGCGQIGHGVVLWPAETDDVEAGAVVRVYGSANLRDGYSIGGGRERFDIERWRVQLFRDRVEAEDYAVQFTDYASTFARSERTALPVRSDLNRLSSIVYRLRNGEIIKVLGRSPEQSDEAGLVAHWYRVLTGEGVEGWAFGYHLTIFERTTGAPVVYEQGDAQTYAFLNGVWRPAYFRQMIEAKTYDLERFQIGYGLFPSPREGRILLTLPERELEFYYEAVVPVGQQRLALRDSSLSVQFVEADHITIDYLYDGERFSDDLYRIEENINAIVNREQARREVVYSDLLRRGSRWRNARYGTVDLSDDKRFVWRTRRSLAFDASSFGGMGRVEIAPSIVPRLRQSYGGALTFHFDTPQERPSLVFVYRLRAGGIELTPVMEEDWDEWLVARVSSEETLVFSH